MLVIGDLIRLTIGVVVAPLSMVELGLMKKHTSLDILTSPTFLEVGDVIMLLQIIDYPADDNLDLYICLIGGREGLFWCPAGALNSASTLINHT